MTYVLVASAGIAGVLLFLLSTATQNSPFFAEYYQLLLWTNVAVAAVLIALVVYQLVRIARQRRAKVFGSLLTFRVLVMFALVGLVPGVLVYLVSLQFLVKSIDSWFDVRVEKALEGGLNLGRAALDAMLADLVLKAQVMALDLSEVPAGKQAAMLARLREQVGTEDAVLVSSAGTVLASASRDFDKLVPAAPNAQVLRQARANRGYGAVEISGEKALMLRVIVPVEGFALADEPRFLQLTHAVPQSLADHGAQVQTVYRTWRELQLSRDGLKQIYILTLTLTLLLAVFAWFALAFLLSRRLSEPLANLAQATQAVAQGDFSRRAPVTSRDELGILTRSFNSMTEQLDEARRAALRSHDQLETANAYLESVLANLSAGVLVFDPEMRLRIANRGAGSILGQDLGPLTGLALADWTGLETFASAVTGQSAMHGAQPWQMQFELPAKGTVLLVRGSPLPAASGGGHVVVFDDISQLIAAQRASAWGEVARRLAHEIKNPLTPIRLAAERLQAKLAGKLPQEDVQALNRATDNIIVQVNALNSMVDDFRDYARTPAAKLQPLDLNGLVSDVLGLYEQSGTHVHTRLEAGLPPVRGDADRLRQVIHNLLQNAQDALAGRPDPRIEVSTRRNGAHARLDIADNGAGFPDALIKRAFEPYVTTKPKGTGLGLAIVKRIVDEHSGTISVENGPDRGAAVRISLPLAA